MTTKEDILKTSAKLKRLTILNLMDVQETKYLDSSDNEKLKDENKRLKQYIRKIEKREKIKHKILQDFTEKM